MLYGKTLFLTNEPAANTACLPITHGAIIVILLAIQAPSWMTIFLPCGIAVFLH